MRINDINWKIGGEAGEGIMVTGLIFSKACSRAGLQVFDYPEYPSRIRGGHNCYQVRAQESKPVTAEWELDMLVALNAETVTLHLNEMKNDGLIICESTDMPANISFPSIFPVPLEELAVKAGGKITKNNVALGVSFAILQLPVEYLNASVSATFKGKEEKVTRINLEAVRLGYEYVKEHYKNTFPVKMQPAVSSPRCVITGNEAIALGAVKAGLKLYAAYPMTPASSILHFLAPLARRYRILVKHTEDELAAILTAIGANFAGARSMAATSGGGFCLMVEALGMAAITETPLVLVEAQRPGPSTGMPTWTEQGDLRFVMHASQGEFPRIILTPGDASEAYQLIQRAFNYAETFQIPVILMADKFLSESHETVEDLHALDVPVERGKILREAPEGYKRYALSYSDGVSPRAVPPGKNGMQLSNSDDHDEYGIVTEESELRNEMQRKRFKKLPQIEKAVPQPVLYGPQNADISFIGWGTVKLPVLRTIELLKKPGVSANYLHCVCPHPFVAAHYRDFVTKAKKLVCIENNYTGQFASILQEHLLVKIENRLNKYDGRPFFPHEIVEYITGA